MNSLTLIKEKNGKHFLSRREMARQLLAGFASAAVAPLASSHPVWAHLANEHHMDQADTTLSKTGWKPLFLTVADEKQLAAFSEAIVPGSTKALASRFIDLLLSVDTKKHQEEFTAAFHALETECKTQFGKPFSALSGEQQTSFLTKVSTAAENSSVRESFDYLKEWISGAYYSSEIGMRELGWTPDRVFASFPGCAHPDGHA